MITYSVEYGQHGKIIAMHITVDDTTIRLTPSSMSIYLPRINNPSPSLYLSAAGGGMFIIQLPKTEK